MPETEIEKEEDTNVVNVFTTVTEAQEETLIQKIVKRVKDLLTPNGPVQSEDEVEEPVKPIVFIKESDDRYRFFTLFTNCFKDAHREIISDAAHREYVEWVNTSKLYPELHLWHAGSKSKWGQVDWVDYTDGFVAASGLVDQGKEYIVEGLKELEISVSHGFIGIATKDDVIVRYRTFEVSPLPLGNAANKWVDFNFRKDREMPFSEQRKKWLKEIAKVDDSVIADWEHATDKLSANLKSLGIEYKEEGETDIVSTFSKHTEALNSLAETVTGLKQTIETELPVIKAKQADLDKDFDTKVADAFTAQVAKMPNGFKASESKDNVVEGNKQADNKDMSWFGNVISDIIPNRGA